MKAVYIHSDEYVKCCDRSPKVKQRASVTHSLIQAYSLLENFTIVPPIKATVDELTTFHSQDYINYLHEVNALNDLEKVEDTALSYGLGYDCPLLTSQFDLVATIAGGSLTAARCLNDKLCSTAINWEGGWHHGRKDEAAGFCYVNDIVLAVLKLREKHDRVLYIDLDLHHGDAVEDAFAYTTKVMTVSFHKYEEGFYPGTGRVSDVGGGRAKFYAVNVPLKDGIGDQQYCRIFQNVMKAVKRRFRPNAVVCQCGADGLAGDPMACFNLTHKGLGRCVAKILKWKTPTLFLGGGGYHISNTARCWAYLTSIIAGRTISSEIPENPYFDLYGPSFELKITPGNSKNSNTEEHERDVLSKIQENMKHLHSNLSNPTSDRPTQKRVMTSQRRCNK